MNSKVVLYANPLKVEFYIGDYLVTSFNSKQLLKFEHLRVKQQAPEVPQENQEAPAEQAAQNSTVVEDEEPDMWEETFKGHTDSKPNGLKDLKNFFQFFFKFNFHNLKRTRVCRNGY